jgi:S-DNA-T family DNA segregation ATPase FtsK/SpoIIIE
MTVSGVRSGAARGRRSGPGPASAAASAAWAWRRELAAAAVLVWAWRTACGWFGAPAGAAVLAALPAVVLAVPGLRRPALVWLAAGRVRRRWGRACSACGLADDGGRTPAVSAVRPVPAGWELRLRLRAGTALADVERAADRLAAGLSASGVRIAADPADAGRCAAVVVCREPLARPVLPPPLPDPSDPSDPSDQSDPSDLDLSGGLDLAAVGVREDGSPWLLPVRGAHVLVAGATGSGKGSVLWSLVRALAPAAAAGLVEIWACDPKGGMELGFGRALFARFAVDGPQVAGLLEDAAALVRERAARLAGLTRLHEPTPAEPLVVLVVDELAAVTAYADRAVRVRVAAGLGLVLSQGRAVGVSAVGAVQDPRKDAVPLRDLFPVRVLLRVAEAAHADLVLGGGAHARGAHAERIPVGLAGVGYVLADGAPAPVRVRAFWVSDAEVRTVAARYGASPPAPGSGGWVPDVSFAVPSAAPPAPSGSGPAGPETADPETTAPPAVRPAAPPAAPAPRGLPGGGDDASAWEAFAADYRRRHGIADDDEPEDGPDGF